MWIGMKTLQPCSQACNSAQWTDQIGTAVDFSLLTETPFVASLSEDVNDDCVVQVNSTFNAVNCNSKFPVLCQKQCRLKGNFKRSTMGQSSFLNKEILSWKKLYLNFSSGVLKCSIRKFKLMY